MEASVSWAMQLPLVAMRVCDHACLRVRVWVFMRAFLLDGPAAFTCRGDGRLSVMNLKKGKTVAVSEQDEDEFLSVQIMKVCLTLGPGRWFFRRAPVCVGPACGQLQAPCACGWSTTPGCVGTLTPFSFPCVRVCVCACVRVRVCACVRVCVTACVRSRPRRMGRKW
jgi:hypothetical protein